MAAGSVITVNGRKMVITDARGRRSVRGIGRVRSRYAGGRFTPNIYLPF